MKRLLIVLFLVGLATPALAQNAQRNWKPNQFRIHCGTGCPNAALAKVITDAVQFAMGALRAMKFKAPESFGERIAAGTKSDHIRVYGRSTPGFAYASPKCSSSSPKLSHINVETDIGDWLSQPHILYYFLTHELFHIIQYGYPAYKSTGCAYMPGWVGEGTADAVSLAAIRKKFPGITPARGPRFTKLFAGHRSYRRPLNRTFAKPTGQLPQYRTSSFWRHLAEAHHGGKYSYLNKYLSVRPVKQDWLGWLGRNVLADSGVDTALGLVYAGFLADYAGWGDKGQPGEFFGRKHWLAGGFGGCYPLELSPSKPEVVITPALLPTSGACVSLKVTGLSATDSVAVKVGAIIGTTAKPGDASKTDQLHLSWAASSDKKDFHCARWIRGKGPSGMKGKKALGHCVFIPNTGDVKIGGVSYPGRIWNAFRQRPKGSGFESIYVLSRTAVTPSDNSPPKTQRLTATYRFLLDRGQLKVEGTKQATAKKKVVPHLNMDAASAALESVPMYDRSGNPAITYTNPSSIRPTFPTYGGRMPNVGIHTLSLTQMVELENQPYLQSTAGAKVYSAMPLRKKGKSYEPRPLRIGDKGSFPASIMGSSGGTMWVSVTPGRLVVEEFSTFMLRARFSGRVCNIRRATPQNKCPQPQRVEGTIIKAFAGLSLPENRFTVYDTPGTAQYRATKQKFLPAFMGGGGGGGSGGGGGGSGGSGAGAGSSSGGSIKGGCDCSCKSFKKMRDLAKTMKSGKRPSSKVMRKIQKMAQCMQTCGPQYAACKKKKR